MPYFQSEDFLRRALSVMSMPGIGPLSFEKVYRRDPTLKALFQNPNHFLSPAQNKKLPFPSFDAGWIDQTLHWALSSDHFLLFKEDTEYPELLRHIPAAPPLLYFKGQMSSLKEPKIAIVGSRWMTPYGAKTARHFARSFAESGITVVSGLATGIDAEAHQGALEAKGMTLAVMGTGIDHLYPKCNQKLYTKILETGGVLSELPLGTLPHPQNFPRRNRIISGLSLGTLVVEAALKSGSLITARYALEQNRSIFAIPGPIDQPLSQGCLSLIKQGALCTQTPEEVLTELFTPLSELSAYPAEQCLWESESKTLRTILESLSATPTSFNDLIEQTGLAAEVVSSSLFQLELARKVQSLPEGYLKRD